MSHSAAMLLRRFPALHQLAGRAGRRRRVPFIPQAAVADCGATCLAMVLALHGKEVPIAEVREQVGVGRDGSDALGILTAARCFGLRGRGVQVEDLEALRFLPKGSILHWNFSHFVVLDEVEASRVVVVDPAAGRRVVSRDELRRAFTGVALLFETTEDFATSDPRPTGLWRYMRQILEERDPLGRVLLISAVLQILALSTPLLIGLLVDRVVPRGDLQLLTVLCVGLAGLVVFGFLASLVRSFLALQLRTRLDARMTLGFLDHLVSLPFSFFQQRSAGDLMMRLNSNTTIRETLTSSALTGVIDGVLVSLYLVLLLLTHVQMGVLVLCLGLLRVGMYVAIKRRTRELMSMSLEAQARSRGYQVEMFSGIETLKTMGAEERAVEHWSNLFVDELNVSISQGRLSAVFDSLLNAVGVASTFLILAFGAFQVLEGELTLGTMLATNALAAGFLGPLSALVSIGLQLQLLGSYLERINDVLDTPREQEGEETSPPGTLAGRITLEGVSFRYAGKGPLVVNEVDLAIEPGSFVAVVGASGAGKSTLANLLVGLYPPTAGTISYDGRDLASLDLRSVRRQLGIVHQQPYLFGLSVRDNIAMADPSLPLSRVVEAAKLAHVHDDVMAMPMGYDTVIADGGASLSGGQRQRLVLARALVHRPAIMLLDEATSSLDAVTEQAIQQELAQLRCTRLVIAHRLSTIQAADQILVMEGGRIIERGKHGKLLERGGAYARLVAAQVAEGCNET